MMDCFTWRGSWMAPSLWWTLRPGRCKTGRWRPVCLVRTCFPTSRRFMTTLWWGYVGQISLVFSVLIWTLFNKSPPPCGRAILRLIRARTIPVSWWPVNAVMKLFITPSLLIVGDLLSVRSTNAWVFPHQCFLVWVNSSRMGFMNTLILLRHGESEWNAKNLFTGWVDVPLSEKGTSEAVRGGEMLKDSGYLPDVVHTSLLRRAINTANFALDAADRHWIEVKRDWRLNERHYGALQGLDKKQTRDKYGEEQFMTWRRSYDTPPPPIELGSQFSQDSDPRYQGQDIPRAECLKDVLERMLPYWENNIVPDLTSGKTVLVAAHGNSLRALIKHLDSLDEETITGLNVPTGIPLGYDLDEAFAPTIPGGTYLDPDAAKDAIAAVAAQGK